MTPRQVLKRFFHYQNFRGFQLKVVETALSGQDCLVLMPTGGGKSICFQVPALMMTGTTLVISPLISLMKDQVDQLTARGILATYLNSSLSQIELKERLALLSLGSYRLVYLAPERLKNKKLRQICRQIKLPLLVVDEAHCISEWGHDFRIEYQQISDFIRVLKTRPTVMALTATATKRTQDDIVSSLQLKKPKVFTASFERANLNLNIIPCQTQTQKQLSLLKLLRRHAHQVGIIYVATRRSAEDLAAYLKYLEIKTHQADYYHGGLENAKRQAVQDKFLQNQINLIIATNAFGMGIDKPDVRFVIHYQLPASLEAYYQEVGRAGRDGQVSQAYLLYLASDLSVVRDLIISGVDQNLLKFKLKRLAWMKQFATQMICRNRQILTYFDQFDQRSCQRCDVCLDFSLQSDKVDLKLNQTLLAESQKLANQLHVPLSEIMTQNLAEFLSLIRPTTIKELAKAPGIGWGWLKRYSSHILPIILNYAPGHIFGQREKFPAC